MFEMKRMQESRVLEICTHGLMWGAGETPPLHYQSWQQLPVSAIANFHPVVASDLSRSALKTILSSYPYQRFPVVQQDKLVGILTRKEAEIAARENRAPKLEPVTTCLRELPVRELQALLIESSTQVVVLLSKSEGRVLGLITLHDLLRAQEAKAQMDED